MWQLKIFTCLLVILPDDWLSECGATACLDLDDRMPGNRTSTSATGSCNSATSQKIKKCCVASFTLELILIIINYKKLVICDNFVRVNISFVYFLLK